MNANLLLLTLWAASGAAVGGVMTPLLAASRGVNEWRAALAGVIVGGAGNVILLAPLWLFLVRLPRVEQDLLPWQRDAMPVAGEAKGPQVTVLALLRQNFWPKLRADHEHSHRMAYVGVFAALAVITLIEVTLSAVEMPFNVVGPLVALSTTKVLLVAMYFMHLRYDSRWYTAVFAVSVPFAAVVLTVLALS